MSIPGTGVLVLAAGKGTRMKSETPKVLLELLNEPLLYYPMESTDDPGFSGRAVVVGYGSEAVSRYLENAWPGTEMIVQREQLGTGHAVYTARDWVSQFERVIIIPGDVPLIAKETLTGLNTRNIETDEDCTFLVFEPSDPTGYGRVLDTDRGFRIVEEKDALEHEKKCYRVNSGVYVFRTEPLLEQLENVGRENSQGEYYLTDVIHGLGEQEKKVGMMTCPDPDEMEGVNDPLQLNRVSGILRGRILERHMRNGLKCVDSGTVWIGPGVVIGDDVTVEPFVQVWGASKIGSRSRLGSFSIVRDSVLGENVHLLGHVVICDSTAGDNSTLGPFTFVRDGSVLSEGAFAGKFVEIKKSVIGEKAKVPHLTYIGDATVGKGSNIGAGTVTCNFDGEKKNPTIIGEGCFIGSDTMLVAPVTLGDGCYTAAGSIITKDVPAEGLAIGRARQKNIEGWARRRRKADGGGE